MRPATALYPKCWANATVLRSTDTNIAPRNQYTGTSTISAGAADIRFARPRSDAGAAAPASAVPASAGAGAGAGMSPATGGSVARWATNHSTPTRHSTVATNTPAAGCTSVASTVTAAGPRMNTTSSATDSNENAVCSCGEPVSRLLHRARTIEPIDGMVAPATVAGMNSTQSGARSSTALIRPAVATVNAATSGRSTAR